MKKILISIVNIFAGLLNMGAQQSYMAGDGVAVFVPANFDATAHLPSPIFVRDLVPSGDLPADWKLVPKIRMEKGKSVMRLEVGDADLYGTGEVWGPGR